MDIQAARLERRGVVSVAGADARAFLEGLLTCSVVAMRPGDARHGALLTPQGKLLFDFVVLLSVDDEGEVFMLDVSRALAGELVKRLRFYKLRANVDLAEQPGLAVVAVWRTDGGAIEPPVSDAVIAAGVDPRQATLGVRVFVPDDAVDEVLERIGAEPAGVAAYDLRRIAEGIGEAGLDFVAGDVFPHEINLDQLGGIDFHKGCYVGQEVVSRMEHRGTARTRLVPFAYAGGFGPEIGVEIMAGGRTIGRTGSTGGGSGLALVRLDRLGDALAAGDVVIAGGLSAQPLRPRWWSVDWPLPVTLVP